MVAVPLDTAVTTPAWLTVATALLPVDQVAVAPEVSLLMADKVALSPLVSVSVD
jgi:hypothetical protein